MKKFLYALILFSVFLGLSAFSSGAENFNSKFDTEAFATCNYGQCRATAKSTGQRCRHCVSNSGDLYCYQHR